MAARNVMSTSYGGYDHNFIDEVPEELICSICSKVFRDPHLTGCCGQHYCESCLTHWFRKQKTKTCPHCRERNFSHLQNKALKRKIGQLKVYCTIRKEGCKWEGELCNLPTHLDSEEGCGYVKVICPNTSKKGFENPSWSGFLYPTFIQCRTVMRRMDLNEHLTSKCYLRRYKCEYCNHEDTYENVTGDRRFQSTPGPCHYDHCSEKPLGCPNQCGALKIRRKDMTTHREQCPLEPVQCPFQEAGCQTRLVRGDLDNHMATQTQQHLLLTFEMMKKRCDDLEKKNAELEKKCAVLERKGSKR